MTKAKRACPNRGYVMTDEELTAVADALGLQYVEQWHDLARGPRVKRGQARRVLLAIMDRDRESVHADVLAGRSSEGLK